MCPAPPTDPATSPHTNGFTEYLPANLRVMPMWGAGLRGLVA